MRAHLIYFLRICLYAYMYGTARKKRIIKKKFEYAVELFTLLLQDVTVLELECLKFFFYFFFYSAKRSVAVSSARELKLRAKKAGKKENIARIYLFLLFFFSLIWSRNVNFVRRREGLKYFFEHPELRSR